MPNIIAKSLALSLVPLVCFAQDDRSEKKPSLQYASLHVQSPIEESHYRESLLESRVIWDDWRPNSPSPTAFKDLYETHQLSQIPQTGIKKFTMQSALKGDQIALQTLIENHWYTQKDLFKLTDAMVCMANLNSPVAREMLSHFSIQFRPHEVLSVLNEILSKVALSSLKAKRILHALISYSSLEEYAFKEHFEGILSFIKANALDSETPDFICQEKLLLAYRDGHYGIKKNYRKNKHQALDWAKQFALEDDNPEAQIILLQAYKDGHFGIKSRNETRLKEAREFLRQFCESDHPDLQALIHVAREEGWFGLQPLVYSSDLEKSGKKHKPLVTKNQHSVEFYKSLLENVVEDLSFALKGAKSPMIELHHRLLLIQANGFYDINNGVKKNRRLALEALKILATNYDYYPAQTLLIHAYHEGMFGIQTKNRAREQEALAFLYRFAQNNHHVQMLHLTALCDGWFHFDPTDSKIQREALQYAKLYAHKGNRKAQRFLIDTYVKGNLGTRHLKNRYKKALKYRDRFNIYPDSPRLHHANPYEILMTLENLK